MPIDSARRAYPAMILLRCTLAFLICVAVCPCVPAQTAPRASSQGSAAQPASAAETAALVAAARADLAAGRPNDAIVRVNVVLGRDPGNRQAVEVKATALVEKQQLDQALATYDAYVNALRKPDAGVLALIARAHLKRLLRQPQTDLAGQAGILERLARDGDAEALGALRRSAASTKLKPQEALELNASLTRLGDEDAAARLGNLLQSAPSDGKSQVIRLLQDAGASSQASKVAVLLGDSQPDVRSAAALAAGVLKYTAGMPRLRELFQNDVPIVQMFAAVALRRLGETSVDSYLALWLKNGVPEVRLTVAEAYQDSKSTYWIDSIKELLGDRNELVRLRAAEALAFCDQSVARAALTPALGSANPLLRAEAARILEAKNLADVSLARKLLGDQTEVVRVRGAGVALRLAAAAPSQSR